MVLPLSIDHIISDIDPIGARGGGSPHITDLVSSLLDLEVAHRLVNLPVQNSIAREHVGVQRAFVIGEVKLANHL